MLLEADLQVWHELWALADDLLLATRCHPPKATPQQAGR